MEGSLVDRTVLSILIVWGILILYNRRGAARKLFRNNKALLAFTLYLGITVLWSDISEVSFKRWVRLVGNLVMAAVLMTEAAPLESVRSVFRRTAYLLIPLSVILVKYFPGMGVLYTRQGQLLWTGVALMKNALGFLSFVMALFLLWDASNSWGRNVDRKYSRLLVGAVVLVMSLWLLRGPEGAHSATAIGCLILGTAILIGLRAPVIKRNFRKVGALVILSACMFSALELAFGAVEPIVVDAFGRNMTFTDRVPLWNTLVELGLKRPLLGYGYGGFWTAERIAYINVRAGSFGEGHSGYLEIFVEGGLVGIILLGVLLISVLQNIQRSGLIDYEYAVLRLSFFATILVANVTESVFAGERDILTFVFYVIALNYATPNEFVRRHISIVA